MDNHIITEKMTEIKVYEHLIKMKMAQFNERNLDREKKIEEDIYNIIDKIRDV